MAMYIIIFATLTATTLYGWSGERPKTKKNVERSK